MAEEVAALPLWNHAHAVDRSVASRLSEYFRANVWLVPLPDAGVTESAVMVAAAGAGTVQAPRVYQPLFEPPMLAAYMKTLFGPLNPGLNVVARLRVRLLPDGTAELDPSPIAQLRFCTVALVPTVPVTQPVPASLIRLRTFVARS